MVTISTTYPSGLSPAEEPGGSLPHRAVVESARRLLAFLEANRATKVLAYPFSWSFPHNCCESVSIIFCFLLEERYGLKDVAIIRGTDPRRYEHHFWVQVGERIYDLTAHQFRGRRPILGAVDTPLALRFKQQQRMHDHDFVDRKQIVRFFRKGLIPF